MLNKTWEFIGFLVIPEQDMDDYSKLAGSYAIVKCSGKFLICYNKWRQQWEFPADKREIDESAMQCAIRELYEETGQLVTDFTFKGLLKSKNLTTGAIKYNPVYLAEIQSLQPFIKNDEIEKIMLWDLKEDIGPFDELDWAIITFI